MKKKEAISTLNRQIDEIKKVKATEKFGYTFTKWQRDTRVALLNIFSGDSNPAKEFNEIDYSLAVAASSTPQSEYDRAYLRGLEMAEAFLESCIRQIEDYWSDDDEFKNEKEFDPYSLIEKLCSRFHLFAKQLKVRHDNRVTLDVADEYDLQDLFHGILRIFFDDIRPEEWTPSYAGKSSRMDFLLKDHRIVIETKMTRKGFGAKEIGTQLIEDIARYRRHPDCNTLICFVYDHEGFIANPAGLAKDLSTEENGFSVKVKCNSLVPILPAAIERSA
jgi:hypothetical protein